MVCVFAANAQHVVTTGKPYAVIDAQSKFYFSKNSQVMAVKNSRKEGLSIQKFRQDLSFEKIKLYNDFEKGYVIESVTEFDGKYYVFYSSWNGSQEQLFAREIDFDKGEFTGKGKKIVTVNEKVSGDMATTGFYSMAVVNKFDFFFSHDSSKLLVQYRVRPAVKTDS